MSTNRYVKSVYSGGTTYDVTWTDRKMGKVIMSYDGADPANTNPAYGGMSDYDAFLTKGLDIREKIEESDCVCEAPKDVFDQSLEDEFDPGDYETAEPR